MFKSSVHIFLAVIFVITSLFVSTPGIVRAEGVQPTPFFSIFYGTIGINGTPAPIGTLVQFVTPRGEIVGEWTVINPGILALTQVYGADQYGTPGFLDNEIITVHINGLIAQTNKTLVWHNDWNPQEIEISQITESQILEISSYCQAGEIVISFDGTASSYNGSVWGTITGNGYYDIPFLFASFPANARATLKTYVTSIKTGDTMVFLENTAYNLKLWSGSYEQGPSNLIDDQTVTTLSCDIRFQTFLPVIFR